MNSRSLKPARLALAILVPGICLAASLQAQAFASAHWKSTAEIAGGAQGSMKTQSELWMKDRRVRTKTTAMGMKVNVVKSGDFLYQWQEGQTAGMKMSTKGRQRGASADYVNRIEDVRTKGKKTGSATVDGHACDIY